MIFYIILDVINLDYIFSEVIILNISYLSVFISFLHQIFKMIRLHLFYDFDQSIVKSTC